MWVIPKLLKIIFRADWYEKEQKKKVKIKVIVKIMENYFSCLVSSNIHNIVRIYNQVLMANRKFGSKKKIVLYMTSKILNQMLGTQRRI